MLKVSFKFSTGIDIENFDMPLSEFIYMAPEWDIDFDMIVKIEVV